MILSGPLVVRCEQVFPGHMGYSFDGPTSRLIMPVLDLLNYFVVSTYILLIHQGLLIGAVNNDNSAVMLGINKAAMQ